MKAEIYLEESSFELVLTPETEEDQNAVESFMTVMEKPMKVDVTGFGCNRKVTMSMTLSISQHSTWSKFYPRDKEIFIGKGL